MLSIFERKKKRRQPWTNHPGGDWRQTELANAQDGARDAVLGQQGQLACAERGGWSEGGAWARAIFTLP